MSASIDPSDLPTSRLEELVEELPPGQRTDYRAVEIEGKVQAQQARDRGVTDAAVSLNLSKARENLRELADERAPVVDDRVVQDTHECIPQPDHTGNVDRCQLCGGVIDS